LRFLRDQRQGHELAGPRCVRAGVPVDPELPGGSCVGAAVLRGRLPPAAGGAGAPGDPRRREHPTARAVISGATIPGVTDARLKFFWGPMDGGKSTLALQMDHNRARQGRRGLVFTTIDRSGQPRVTTRIGLQRHAIEVTADLDLREVVRARASVDGPVDYLIC